MSDNQNKFSRALRGSVTARYYERTHTPAAIQITTRMVQLEPCAVPVALPDFLRCRRWDRRAERRRRRQFMVAAGVSRRRL